ncbi:MAG: hypothetical protein ACLTVU_17095 [Phocaeicola plebeius]
MIKLIKDIIFAWRYKRAVARACKYANSTEESTTSCIWVAN